MPVRNRSPDRLVRSLRGVFSSLPGSVRAGIWMSLSAIAFVVSLAISKLLAPDIHVFQIVFLRNAFAMVFMLPWFMRVGRSALQTQRIGRHILRGTLSSINVTLLFAATAFLPIADISAINFLQPVIGAAIAVLFLGEVAGVKRWAAILVGFVGAVAVIRPGFTELNWGILFALGSTLSGAVITVLIKTLVRTDTPDTIAAWLFITQTALLVIPTAIVWKTPPPELWILIGSMGLASFILQRTFNRGIQAADVSVAMPFNFTRLIWAAVLGWAVFGDFPDVWTWIGGAIIFGASLWLTIPGLASHRSGKAS